MVYNQGGMWEVQQGGIAMDVVKHIKMIGLCLHYAGTIPGATPRLPNSTEAQMPLQGGIELSIALPTGKACVTSINGV